MARGVTPIRGKSGHARSGSLRIPAGATLFDPDHPSRRVYQLRSGRVRLAGRRREIFDHLAPGDFFGENCFLAPPPGQIATTLSPVEVVAFRKRELLDRLARDRRFAARVLRSLATRLARYEETIGGLMKEPAERRLAILLLRLAPEQKAKGLAPLPFIPTNRDLAEAIGTTRWRVSHFLGRFQRFGWLRRRHGLWVDRERLGEFLRAA